MLKWRGRWRMAAGASPVATAEIGVGALIVLASGLGVGRERPLAWSLVAVGLGVIGLSLSVHLRGALRERGRRAASEAERLRRAVAPGRGPPFPPAGRR